ncbi:MAG TPA: hypothetical protein ENJ95_21590 [Bacteroidetes bacterium]|nr:hypothetical protein [Bacteroidota bacterium]
MLKDLHIQNYRLFEDFKMDGLARVNLIAGRNNTGKTALLEALRILKSYGDDGVLMNIVLEREEIATTPNVSMDSIFNRTKFYGKEKPERISASINNISIERRKESRWNWPEFYRIIKGDNGQSEEFKINVVNQSYKFPNDSAVFVPFNAELFSMQFFWEKISLTPLYDDVINIMGILDPRIEKLDIFSRGAKVKLTGEVEPISLKNLGEGANRLLIIALALVSAKNKLLLIDEFESGLHYSVQEQLWEIIFEYSKKWDIQVFATTHSMDAVRAFYYVSSREEHKNTGKYFRLQKSRKGSIEAISFPKEDLDVVMEVGMEIR